MDKIVIEINGVRHQLVEDKPLGVLCEGCSLNYLCYRQQVDICADLENRDCHFEIEPE